MQSDRTGAHREMHVYPLAHTLAPYNATLALQHAHRMVGSKHASQLCVWQLHCTALHCTAV
jgi:hypothetical protein